MNKQIICISVDLERALFMKHFIEFISNHDVMMFVVNFLIGREDTNNGELSIRKIIKKYIINFIIWFIFTKTLDIDKFFEGKGLEIKKIYGFQ